MTDQTHRDGNAATSRGCRPSRAVQLHPSRRCNLSCRHCYSSSSPLRTEVLPQRLIETVVVDAAAQAYDGANVSGGEPLMWAGLRDTLALAKACGLATTLTTNLIPLTRRRLDRLERVLDAVSIGLDGMPQSHDRIRGKRGAFTAMARRLPVLRAAGIPFGFVFTLTDANLYELPWVARFAIEEGARLLQIQPLEETGRAAALLRGLRPGEIAIHAASLAVMRLRARLGGSIEVRLDLADREMLLDEPRCWYTQTSTDGEAAPLADLVSPLVVEADGWVVPLRHGFSRRHALGNLHEAPLRVLVGGWRKNGGYARYRAEQAPALRESAADSDALPAFDWFGAGTSGEGVWSAWSARVLRQ